MHREFEHVQYLLSAHPGFGYGVAEREHHKEIVEAEVPFREGFSDGAAAYEGEIRPHTLSYGVGAEIPERRFLEPHQSRTALVRIDECAFVGAGASGSLKGVAGAYVLFQLQHRSVGNAAGGKRDQCRMQFPGWADCQFAYVLEGVARRSHQNPASLAVFQDFPGNDAVRMSVEHDVESRRGCHQGPGVYLVQRVHTQVGETYHIVRSCPARLFGGLFRYFGELAGAERIDIVAPFVLEVARGRGHEAVGRGYAHECHFHRAEFLNDVWLVHRCGFAPFIEIAHAYHGIEAVAQFPQALHSVVEFVVAQCHHVVAGGVHQFYYISPFGHRAKTAALHEVACRDEAAVRRRGMQGRDFVVAVYVAVDVVVIEYGYYGTVACGRSCICKPACSSASSTQQERRKQEEIS